MSQVGPITFAATWSDQGFQAGLQKTIQGMQQFDQQLQQTSRDMQGMMRGGGGGFGPMTQQIQAVSTESEKAVSSTQKFGAALKQNALAISLVASSAISIVQGITGIERSHIMAERAANAYTTAVQHETDIQTKLTQARAKFGEGSAEVTKLENALALAHAKTATAQERSSLMQTRYNEQIASFVSNLAPQVVMLGGSIASVFGNMPGLTAKVTNAFSEFKGVLTNVGSSLLNTMTGFTGIGTVAEGASVKVKLMAVAMASIPFAVGAAAAAGFIIAIQQIYTHTAAVHDFFNTLGSDIQTVIPHAKQSFVEMGNAVTDTARFFQIGLDRISNELKLTNINQDITKEKMSELMQQVKDTGSTTIAKFDEITKATIKTWTDAGKTIDQAIAEYKKNDDTLTISAAKTNSVSLITSAAWTSMGKAIETAFNNTKTAIAGFITEATNEVQRLTGIIPSISQTFGTMGGTVVTGLAIINDALKNMKNESITSIEAAAAQVKLGLDKMKTAATEAGGVIKDQFYNAWNAVNQLLANPTHENLVKTATAIQQLDIAIKNNESALKASETGFLHFGNQIVDMATGKVVPAIANIGTGLDAMIPKINNMTAAGSKGFIQFGSYSVDAATGQMKLGSAVNDAASAYQASLGPLGSIIDKTNTAKTTYAGFGPVLNNVGGALGALQSKAQGLTDPLGSIITVAKQGSTVMTTFGNGVKDAQKQLDDLNHAISAGTEMRDALNLGFVNASLALVKLKVDTEQARGELLRMNQALADGTLVAENYQKGLVAGGLKFVDLIAKAAQAAGEQKTYNDALTQTTGSFFKLNPLLEQNTKNMELVAQAMTGDAAAAKSLGDEMLKAFEPLGGAIDKLIGGVAGKFDDLNKRVKKPFADLPKYIVNSMTPDERQFIITQGRFQKLGEQSAGAFGTALMLHGAQGGLDFLNNLQGSLKGADLKGALEPAIIDLQNAVANQGTPAGKMWVQKAIAELQKLGLSGPQITALLTKQFGNAGTTSAHAFNTAFNQAMSSMSQWGGGTPVKIPGATTTPQGFTSVVSGPKAPTITADPFAPMAKSLSLLNAVVLNSQKDISLLNAVVVNSSKDLSALNAVVVNSQKDFSTLNDVSVNSQKDFSLLNAVLVNSQKDLDAAKKSADALFASLGKLASEITGALVKAMDTADRVLVTMAGNIGKVGSAASSATGLVKSLASAINSLQSKSITLTTVHRDVFTTTLAQHGMHSTVYGPTPILAGEAGPERVDITPLTNPNNISNYAMGGGIGILFGGGGGSTGRALGGTISSGGGGGSTSHSSGGGSSSSSHHHGGGSSSHHHSHTTTHNHHSGGTHNHHHHTNVKVDVTLDSQKVASVVHTIIKKISIGAVAAAGG